MLAGLLASGVAPNSRAIGQTQPTQANGPAPVPARNDVARPLGPADEVLMLRHQFLQKGAHEVYYRASLFGVWPWYERLGARITGQWQVVYPERGGRPDLDEGYRLARYASFEHWRYTRGRLSLTLAGNGPNRDRNNQAGLLRRQVSEGSKGGYFLQGLTATTRPQFLPGIGVEYELVNETRPAAGDDVIAVRNDVAQPGTETIELVYARIRKGAFDEILEATVDHVWPFEEKIGARPIGQWKVIYPDEPSRTEESSDYDEMITMTRYASYDHYLATRPGQAVLIGGNGPDWQVWRDALAARGRLVTQTAVEFLQGFNHMSPPMYQPALRETYRVK
jgi:hypothetical protein